MKIEERKSEVPFDQGLLQCVTTGHGEDKTLVGETIMMDTRTPRDELKCSESWLGVLDLQLLANDCSWAFAACCMMVEQMELEHE